MGIYAQGRRPHRHRCRCCNRIIKEGVSAIFLRTRRGSLAIHAACGDRRHSPAVAWFEAMEAWGREYQRSLGFKVDEPMPWFFGRGPAPAASP